MSFSERENIISFGVEEKPKKKKKGFPRRNLKHFSSKINVLTENIPFLFLSLKKKKEKQNDSSNGNVTLSRMLLFQSKKKKKKEIKKVGI